MILPEAEIYNLGPIRFIHVTLSGLTQQAKYVQGGVV